LRTTGINSVQIACGAAFEVIVHCASNIDYCSQFGSGEIVF